MRRKNNLNNCSLLFGLNVSIQVGWKVFKNSSIFEAPRECDCARASMRVEELNELDRMHTAIQNRRNK